MTDKNEIPVWKKEEEIYFGYEKGNPYNATLIGDAMQWKTICGAQVGSKWSRFTTAMQLGGGCIVRCSTHYGLTDPHVMVESMVFVPGANIIDQLDEEGRVVRRRLV